MVRDIPFEVLDVDRFIQCRSPALGFALVIAHPAAGGGKGIGLEQDPVGIVKPSGPNQGEIARNVHLDGTGVHAGRFEKRRAYHCGAAFIPYVGVVLVSKITDGRQHRVGGCLPQAAQRRVLDDVAPPFQSRVDGVGIERSGRSGRFARPPWADL